MKNLRLIVLSTLLMIAGLSVRSYGQSYSVKGTVSAGGTPVRYAAVLFTDNTDTLITYDALTDSTGAFDLGSINGVKQSSPLPTAFMLEQNYPNPFSASTAISYSLDQQSAVKVTIYDVLGRVVKNYTLGYESAGQHGIIWNGRNHFGEKVAPGVYFYRLQARGQAQVRKMVYGFGSSKSMVSLGVLPSSEAPGTAGLNRVSVGHEIFTITIENTDSTSPLIVPQKIYNLEIQSDTSLTLNTLNKMTPAVVYMDSTEQEISGFGGADALIFYQDMTSAEVHSAFDSTSGNIGLTILRVSIPPDSSQFTRDVPTAKLAESLGAKVIATPWTPPTWMKTNNNISGGSLDTSAYGIFADYLKSFADTMSNNGAPIYAVSVQNEPDFNASYQSCLWNATQFLNFMKYYAPQVGTPVLMPESASMNYSLSTPTLNDSEACAHTAFVAEHIYGATPAPYPLAIEKGKQVWMTEYLIDSGNPPTNTSIDTGWTGAMMAAKSINDVMNSDMSAYVWWQIPRYYSLIGDGGMGTVAGQVTKKGFVTAQFARFVRPGYYRVYSTQNPQPGVYLTAYKGGSKTVLVVLNTNSNSVPQPIAIMNGSATSFTPYETSITKNVAQGSNVALSGGSFTVKLDASSVTTFVSN